MTVCEVNISKASSQEMVHGTRAVFGRGSGEVQQKMANTEDDPSLDNYAHGLWGGGHAPEGIFDIRF